MYNLSSHYENIFQHLQSIITDPRVVYLHPFGSTQPENIEIIRPVVAASMFGGEEESGETEYEDSPEESEDYEEDAE